MQQFAPHACPNKQAIWDEEGGSQNMFERLFKPLLSYHVILPHNMMGTYPEMHNACAEIMIIFLSNLLILCCLFFYHSTSP
jgi:hypothetical protein